VFSAYGYIVIDSFIAVAQKAGPNLTTDTFIKAMDTMDFSRRHLRQRAVFLQPHQRLGSNAFAPVAITDGKWEGNVGLLQALKTA